MTLFRDHYRVESARHPRHDYTHAGWYFVTICIHQHRCVLGSVLGDVMQLNALGSLVSSHLSNVPAHYSNVRLDEFVIMPNHLHMLIETSGEPHLMNGRSKQLASGSLGAIIGGFKAGVTRECNLMGRPLAWQSRFYDSILRAAPAINAVRQYIRENPKNWSEDEFYKGPETARGPSLP